MRSLRLLLALAATCLAAAGITGLAAGQAFPKLDDSWTVSVNGQVVPVGADGSFAIPNVSAADQYGAGGVGTPPDFVSDDYLRVIGISTAGGATRYAYSSQFKFVAGQEFSVGQLTIANVPPPFPESIVASALSPVLTSIGSQTTVQVIGTLIDGSQLDVTSHTAGTTYRTSNPLIVTVDQDGVATAMKAGVVFVTALNEGATSVTQISVVPGDPLTQVVGFVEFEDGTPASGATVTVVGQGLSSTSQADGSFAIPGVATQLGKIGIQASLGNLKGNSVPVDPVPGALTDAGLIALHPVQDVLVFGDYSPANQNLQQDLISLGRVVTFNTTLPPDLSGFGTIWHVGAFTALTTSERARLAAFVASGGGLHLTGERPCCEVLNDSIELLVNSMVVGGGVQVGNLGDIGGPYPFNASAAGGVATNPNGLTFWSPSAPGGMGGLGGLPGPNILATGALQRPVGAAWDCTDLVGGTGRVTLFMDVNWFENANRLPVIENIQTFLEGACGP